MPSLRPILIVCAIAGALALIPSQALALSPVISDCNSHNKLTHHYSVSQLRSALASMPADVKEYTSCYQIVEAQLFHQLGKKVPGSAANSSSGGSFLSTPVLIAVIVVILLGGGLAYVAARRGGGGSPPSAPAE